MAGKGANTSGGDPSKRVCLKVPEAAEMLGISRNHAYQMVGEGILPAKRLGKRIIIPRAALEKMLEECGNQ